MASYSRYLFRMLPLRRWPVPSLAPLWLSEPQPACRLLWPAGPSFVERVVNDVERHFQEMEQLSRTFFQASALPASELGGGQKEAPAAESVSAGGGEKGQVAGGGQYRFSVDVAGFAPEELTVKLEGRKVTVTAQSQRESGSEESGRWTERQELRRETLLPPDADLQAVACSLGADGQLAVEAPRLAPAAKALPIDVEPAATEKKTEN